LKKKNFLKIFFESEIKKKEDKTLPTLPRQFRFLSLLYNGDLIFLLFSFPFLLILTNNNNKKKKKKKKEKRRKKVKLSGEGWEGFG
jgi:hypothetical protein